MKPKNKPIKTDAPVAEKSLVKPEGELRDCSLPPYPTAEQRLQKQEAHFEGYRLAVQDMCHGLSMKVKAY